MSWDEREGLKRERYSTYWNIMTRAPDGGPFNVRGVYMWSSNNLYLESPTLFQCIWNAELTCKTIMEQEPCLAASPKVCEQKSVSIRNPVWPKRHIDPATEGWTMKNLFKQMLETSHTMEMKKKSGEKFKKQLVVLWR